MGAGDVKPSGDGPCQQNGIVEGAFERDAVVAGVGSLVEKARQAPGRTAGTVKTEDVDFDGTS